MGADTAEWSLTRYPSACITLLSVETLVVVAAVLTLTLRIGACLRVGATHMVGAVGALLVPPVWITLSDVSLLLRLAVLRGAGGRRRSFFS